jgi:hypothetical protein
LQLEVASAAHLLVADNLLLVVLKRLLLLLDIAFPVVEVLNTSLALTI